ncbi:DUF6461 domain-containing protein [Gordonia polyisoprenivorans]|uniref:DUF6461 domain-containing protein n=1 Tax=Gordonia polyisoprenivorans TaxID=84595 RepID=UPI001AD743A0|nr:DUF6461 domain-containing protein [Gordonia polyisoprenivorans]QTI69784.1 hypothetical protein J6U32_04040 [Gordonia polyisoprenivorans]
MERQITYEDYLWTENAGTAGEFQAFCLSLVENANVDDVLAQLPVIEDLGSMNFREELRFRSYDDWDPERSLVGLFQHDSWTVLFEVNGFAGVTPQIALPLSNGRRIVSHYYSDGNGSGTFKIYEDGRLAASFEPTLGIVDLWTDEPNMSTTLSTLMRKSGFDQAPNDHLLDGRKHNRAATFALMERLTGVQLQPTAIADATFTFVRVQLPRP